MLRFRQPKKIPSTPNPLPSRTASASLFPEPPRAEAVLIDTLERSLTIEGILGIPPACSRVEGHRCSSIAHWEEIDAQADALRSAWNLGLGPLPGLCALLETRGIRVVEGDLPQRIGVLACRALRGCTVVAEAVLLSNQLSIEQKRLALAHELAQRIVGSTGNPEIGLKQARDRFASAFLVPRQHLRKAVGLDSVGMGTRRHRTTWHEIIQLKQMYGVSAATLLTRLEQVGALSATVVRRAFRTFARPWRKIEPEPIVGSAGLVAFERPRRLERLVWRAVGEDLISRFAQPHSSTCPSTRWKSGSRVRSPDHLRRRTRLHRNCEAVQDPQLCKTFRSEQRQRNPGNDGPSPLRIIVVTCRLRL